MRLGLDIGSTTVKMTVFEDIANPYFMDYQRHGGRVIACVHAMIGKLQERFPYLSHAAVALSGSAGMGIAEASGLPFIQEVHATRIALRHMQPDADIAIELGGEDAKILFLSGQPDARMNGSCAGGTGAFIDQMASLMKLSPLELNEKATQKTQIHSIASRCGVFAKSDLQPLMNQGARMEDLAASIFYAVVNQTIAGLAQGREIAGKILYLGGPLTFLSELRAAFDHVLKVEGILPENSLYYVAIGTALDAQQCYALTDVQDRLDMASKRLKHEHTAPLFTTGDAYQQFQERHARAGVQSVPADEAYAGTAHLGIDSGSTTIKIALIDDAGRLLHTAYRANDGDAVQGLREELLSMYKRFPQMRLCSATATGYGEQMVRAAFRADYGLIETMAHYIAAKHFQPDVDFIIDIGGQDMKCFRVEDGSIGDIFLNEACSSGCGSFLQTFAEALGHDIQSFSSLGLFADAPVDLGSRCTVFMNSSVKQAQKQGASIENISAGLSISVVKNAVYKVIRAVDPSMLGRNIVVQGGTFLNDAVLRAFEMELGYDVIRPDIAGHMGAFGAALYGRQQAENTAESAMLSYPELLKLTHKRKTAPCARCGNRCLLTVNTFDGTRQSISGNRCDRPVVHHAVERKLLDLYAEKQQLLTQYQPVPGRRGRIGIPMGLNLYELLPFWHTIFTELGFEVVTSPPSTRKLYYAGQRSIPSDTACYPAKLMHGHVQALLDRDDIDVIFYPCMTYNIDEGLGDNYYNCPVVAYYPEVIQANHSSVNPKKFIGDYVGIHREKYFPRKFHSILSKYFDGISYAEVKRAVLWGYGEYARHMEDIGNRAMEIIRHARAEGRPIIVLAGRPYHIDEEINHGINTLIEHYGAAVVSEDGISSQLAKHPTHILNQWTYHARLFSAARYVAKNDDMQLVQLVSFGCGLDAVTSDEVREILFRAGKLYTQIKIDEITNLGAVNIRLRSLFAAIGWEDASAVERTKRSSAV